MEGEQRTEGSWIPLVHEVGDPGAVIAVADGVAHGLHRVDLVDEDVGVVFLLVVINFLDAFHALVEEVDDMATRRGCIVDS